MLYACARIPWSKLLFLSLLRHLVREPFMTLAALGPHSLTNVMLGSEHSDSALYAWVWLAVSTGTAAASPLALPSGPRTAAAEPLKTVALEAIAVGAEAIGAARAELSAFMDAYEALTRRYPRSLLHPVHSVLLFSLFAES